MTTFLNINGADIPVAQSGSNSSKFEEIGDKRRAFSGKRMSTRRAIKRDWSFRTTPVTGSVARKIAGLVQGLGDNWNFDTDTWSSKGQNVTGGVYTLREGEGKYGGAIAAEVGTTNLLTANQSDVETDLTGLSTKWYSVSNTVERDTTHAWEGTASAKVTCGVVGSIGLITTRITISASTTYSASAYVRASAARSVEIRFEAYDAGGSYIGQFGTGVTLTASADGWVRVSSTGVSPSNAASSAVLVSLIGCSVGDILWADGLQLEQQSFSTSWTLGGTTRADGYLNLPQVLEADEGTLMCWVKPNALEGFISLFKSDIDTGQFVLFTDQNSDKVKWQFGAYSDHVAGDFTPVLEQWFHVAMVWSKSSNKRSLYANGALLATSTFTPPSSMSSSLPVVSADDVRGSSVQGTFTPGIAYVAGKFGQAVPVQGKYGGYVGDIVATSSPVSLREQGSISVWFRPEQDWNSVSGYQRTIIAGFDSNYYSRIFLDTGNNVYITLWDASTGSPLDTIIYTQPNIPAAWQFAAGTWNHVVVTWDRIAQSNNVIITINGVSAAVSVTGVKDTTPSILYFGSLQDGENPLNAIFDDAAAWSRVLSSSEITDLYNSGTGKTSDAYADSDLLFYWNMDGSGNLATGTTATVTGAATGVYPQLQADTTGASSGTAIALTGADTAGFAVGDEVVIAGAGAVHCDSDAHGAVSISGIPDDVWNGSFSLETAVNPSDNGDAEQVIMSCGLTNARGFRVWYNTAGQIRFTFAEMGGTMTAASADGTLQFGKWQSVACVYDVATQTGYLFINGVQVASDSGPMIPPSGDSLELGFSVGWRLTADLDEVRVWNIALDQATIQANMHKEITDAPGLVARYGFNEQTGTTAADTAAAINLLNADQADFEVYNAADFFVDAGVTLSQDATTAWHGSNSLKVVTDATGTNQGFCSQIPNTVIGDTYTFSLYAKGSGTVFLEISEAGSGQATVSSNVTLTSSWQRIEVTRTITTYTTQYLYIRTASAQAVTFNVDGVQFQKSSSATTWTFGGKTPLNGTLNGAVTWRGDGVLGAQSDRVTIATGGVASTGLTVGTAITDTYGVGAKIYRTKRSDGLPTNRVFNGGFELSTVPYSSLTNVNAYVTSSNVFSGQQGLAIAYTGSNGQLFQSFGVSAGDNYTLSAWLKGNGSVGPTVWVYNEQSASFIVQKTNTSSSWTNTEVPIQIPSGCTSIQVGIFPPSDGTTVYVDDLKLTPQLAINGGMEGTANIFQQQISGGNAVCSPYNNPTSITVDNTKAWEGNNSIKISPAPSNSQVDGFIAWANQSVPAGATVTGSIYMWIPSGQSFVFGIRYHNSGGDVEAVWTGAIAGNDAWQRVIATWTNDTGTNVDNIGIQGRENADQAVTYDVWIDGLMLQFGDTATAWEVGGGDNGTAFVGGVAPGWLGTNCQASTDSHSGTKAQLVLGDGSQASLHQGIALTANKWYLFSAWVKSATTATTVGVVFELRDDGTAIRSLTYLVDDTGYVRIAFMAKAGTSSELWLYLTGGDYHFLVDDVQVIPLEDIDITATPCSEANSYEPAKFGDGLHIGYGDSLTFPAANLNPAEGTVEMWVKGVGDVVNQSNTYGFLFDWDSTDRLYATFDWPSNTVGFGKFVNAVGVGPSSVIDLRVGINHLAFSWGSAGMKLYINGVLSATTNDTAVPNLSSASSLYIGQSAPSVTNSSNLIFDSVRLFRYQLQDSEVAAHAAATTAPTIQYGEVILAPLDSNTATDIHYQSTLLDDIVALPFAMEDADIANIYAQTSAFAKLPQLTCSGKFTTDSEVTCEGEVTGGSYVPFGDETGWYSDGQTLDIALVES